MASEATSDPRVERTHNSVDRDRAAAPGSRRRRSGRRFSDEQKRRMQFVYLLHLRDLHRWRQIRRVETRLQQGRLMARWSPARPRLPWTEIAHGRQYGIFADSAERVREWVKSFGGKLRRFLRDGTLVADDLPIWMVSGRHPRPSRARHAPRPRALPPSAFVTPSPHTPALGQAADEEKWWELPPREEWPVPPA